MVLLQSKNEKKIKVMIASKGFTLRGFADFIGVSHSYLSQILNGHKNPSATVALKISNGLGVSIETIFFIRVVDELPLGVGEKC